jgi:hypothetical protein
MARKYDFNYGGARANYNQVAGVGQMVEQGLKRFGDMTQKIQDEETRLVTDAAFAEWRATGEVPQDLDPKVNLEQFMTNWTRRLVSSNTRTVMNFVSSRGLTSRSNWSYRNRRLTRLGIGLQPQHHG